MKKFIASLLLVGVLGFVGCGEKTTGEKVDDAVEDTADKAADAKEDIKDAAEDAKKDLKKLAE